MADKVMECASMHLNVNTKAQGCIDISVLFPECPPSLREDDIKRNKGPVQVDLKYQTLYLLHGGGGDFMSWLEGSRIAGLARKHKLIVVMPTLYNITGFRPQWGDDLGFLTDELPRLIRSILPSSEKKKNNFIFGGSYGGYQAVRAALAAPDIFGYAGSSCSPLDVACDIAEQHAGDSGFPDPESITGTDHDIFYLARKVREAGKDFPKIFQGSVHGDFAWNYNIEAKRKLAEIGLETEWIDFEGVHGMPAHSNILYRFFDWLPLADGPLKE